MIAQLIIILVITNVGLFLLLRFIFHRQLDVAIQRLQKLHQENLDREAQLKREYELAQEEHRKEVEKGKEEAAKIKEIAKEGMNRLKEEITVKAKEEAEALIASGKKEAEEYKELAKQDLDKKAIKISLELVKSTFSSQAVESLHAQFIDEIIAVIDKLDDPRLKIHTDEVKISAAFPINEKQKAALLSTLNHKTGRQLHLEIKTDESIIAGLIINLGELILDASLQNRLRRALEHL